MLDDKSSNLERMKARIRALHAKTVENGCTEAEALSAAGKVADLLEQHGLSVDDLKSHQARCVTRHTQFPQSAIRHLSMCASAVAEFADCKVWMQREGQRSSIFFFGLEQDVEAAEYLIHTVRHTIEASCAQYKRTQAYRSQSAPGKASATRSFSIGMAISIANKLRALKSQRKNQAAEAGRELVLLKTNTVDGEFADLGMQFRRTRTTKRMVSKHAFDAGTDAASNFQPVKGLKS